VILTWPWIESYCVPSCITRDLYLHTKCHWNRRNFLWTDVRTYGRVDGHLRPQFIRSTRRRRPNKLRTLINVDRCRQFASKDLAAHHRRHGLQTPRLRRTSSTTTCARWMSSSRAATELLHPSDFFLACPQGTEVRQCSSHHPKFWRLRTACRYSDHYCYSVKLGVDDVKSQGQQRI